MKFPEPLDGRAAQTESVVVKVHNEHITLSGWMSFFYVVTVVKALSSRSKRGPVPCQQVPSQLLFFVVVPEHDSVVLKAIKIPSDLKVVGDPSSAKDGMPMKS